MLDLEGPKGLGRTIYLQRVLAHDPLDRVIIIDYV